MSALERYFQPNPAFAVVAALTASQYLVWALYALGGSPDFVFGGDFIAFWSAARETLNGDMIGLYAPDGLQTAMQTHRPGQEVDGLTWQYPPHAGLVFSPIGALPFLVAYALWCGLGLACFALVLQAIGLRGRVLIALLATMPVLIVLNTGQNALFTGSLLLLAVFKAGQKPILAGVAAALLTIKPQLGFLLPVLFIASGNWRAFFVAALGSVTLWGLSFALLGPATWSAFLSSVSQVSGAVTDGQMPLYKMVNVYAAARLAWLPDLVAMALAALTLLAAVLAVIWIARQTEDPRWQYCVLATATLIAAPYSMYYELILLVPAVWFVLEQGAKSGWLRLERESVAVLVLLGVIVPGPATQIGPSLSLLTVTLVAVIVLRRLRRQDGAGLLVPAASQAASSDC